MHSQHLHLSMPTCRPNNSKRWPNQTENQSTLQMKHGEMRAVRILFVMSNESKRGAVPKSRVLEVTTMSLKSSSETRGRRMTSDKGCNCQRMAGSQRS